MSAFKSPRRRITRQKSGFSVSGDKKGSTCKIIRSNALVPRDNQIQFVSNVTKIEVPALFKKELGILGVGLYCYPESDCKISVSISWEGASPSEYVCNLSAKKWQRVGVLKTIEMKTKSKTLKSVKVAVMFETNNMVNVFGYMVASIDKDYFVNNDVYEAFQEKTSLYIPEILFKDPTSYTTKYHISKGSFDIGMNMSLVCKSCNRCARFLPIDITDERNTLAFSNHCVSKAPCKHPSFSQYLVEDGDKNAFRGKVKEDRIQAYYGHQLECIVCKKFFVNLPLNPLRNSTQHREDSLRRRAIEVMVDTLLSRKWVYHEYRIRTGKEFDVEIWSKFKRKCFNCGKAIGNPKLMHLDHTMPLVYFYPLDETATCLCSACNSSKSDKFPVDYYSLPKIQELSALTKVPIKTLRSKQANGEAVEKLIKNVVWFFDVFLANKSYQKIRNGKRSADLIFAAINNSLRASGYTIDLVDLYKRKTGHNPTTVTNQ